MDKGIKEIFVDPVDKGSLEKFDGFYQNPDSSRKYEFRQGIPDFIFPFELNEETEKSKEFYEGRAKQYDDTLHLTFFTHNLDEDQTRNSFIDELRISDNSKVLEVACGTGRDSVLIAERLTGNNSELHVQDIALDMILRCREKLNDYGLKRSFCLSNASFLPYPDDYFDSCYSFGALGEIPDKKKTLEEMVRVTKPGGRVVFGDESVPVWHRDTKFYEILLKTNPMFKAEIPYHEFPVEARKVKVEWVIGGTFYLVSFEVGVGEPDANFDYTIPGIRGGSYRTRYEGQLEGVTTETKDLAWKAVSKANTNMHDWLNELVKKEALKILNEK